MDGVLGSDLVRAEVPVIPVRGCFHTKLPRMLNIDKNRKLPVSSGIILFSG
jgi:hypothetical protein